MKAHGKWTGFVARFYYATGSIYYAYHWFLILGGVGLLASGVMGYLRIPIFTAVSLTSALFLIALGIAFARRIAKVRLSSHNPALKILSIKIDYRLTSVASSEYVREIQAQVLFPVESYESQFHWTGQGHTVGNAIKGVTSVDILDHSGSSDDICRVHFGEVLPAGKLYDFIYGISCSDASRPVRPFMGHTVDSPLKELSLCVRLLPDHQVRSYKRQIFLNSKSNLHLWEEIVTIENPNCNELNWVVPHPQHNLYYRLSW
jgi:hypothetical protein